MRTRRTVPQKSVGMARKSYQAGWEKGASGRVSRTLGDRKLRTPKGGSGGESSGSSSAKPSYPKRGNVSFGRTGPIPEDYDA